MSEIKGQLLGIIIVLMVFAAVGGVMVGVFTKLANNVEAQVNEVVSEQYLSSKWKIAVSL